MNLSFKNSDRSDIMYVSTNVNDQLYTERVIDGFMQDSKGLAQDAADTQEPYYQQHFSRSREAIIEAMEGLKNTALILGVGGANDIPLLELADQFDHVILADMDLSSTEKALESIPVHLKSKFHLKQEDLTGFFSELAPAAEE